MAKVKQLSNKEIKVLKELFSQMGLIIKNANIEQYEDEKNTLLLINKKPFALCHKEKWIPTILTVLENKTKISNTYIDAGAIPFITKGADLMKAGITRMEDFDANQIVIIRDNNHSKPIAVGISLYSSEEIKKMEKGKVIQNLHYVGDKVWNFKK